MMDDLVERLEDAHRDSIQRCLGSNIFGEAAEKINEQMIIIEDLAMFVKRLSSSREVNRQAVKYLQDKGLIRSPLR